MSSGASKTKARRGKKLKATSVFPNNWLVFRQSKEKNRHEDAGEPCEHEGDSRSFQRAIEDFSRRRRIPLRSPHHCVARQLLHRVLAGKDFRKTQSVRPKSTLPLMQPDLPGIQERRSRRRAEYLKAQPIGNRAPRRCRIDQPVFTGSDPGKERGATHDSFTNKMNRSPSRRDS